MARLKLILALICLILLLTLIYRNSQAVTVDLLFYKVQLPAAILIAGTAFLGMAAGVVVGARIPRRLKVTGLPTGESPTTSESKTDSEPQPSE